MSLSRPLDLKCPPELDTQFQPIALWNRRYREEARRESGMREAGLGLGRPDGTFSVYTTVLKPDRPEFAAENLRYVERLVKVLLWQRGGQRLVLAGCDTEAAALRDIYSEHGPRAFDTNLIGRKLFDAPISVETCALADMPAEQEPALAIGRHLDGCRIGFDLGGSDRKCAAVIDGEVVHSEEVVWDPYFEADPGYHRSGIIDSLKRAAAHLPRVDAIGGSAAGVYVNNRVRVASLFRGIPESLFADQVRDMFIEIGRDWNVPMVVVNDGEVTALAGSMSLKDSPVLGIAMGTSLAAGYCNESGHLTPWINELAFVPVDMCEEAARDEWSGDLGCGVQYFSQQAVARLATEAGFLFPSSMPLPERLVEVQKHMEASDPRALAIFRTIGTYLGYTLAHYAEFYKLKHLLILGRVTSGAGGEVILEQARQVLAIEFPEWQDILQLHIPDEKMKRHGQAIAAASLPARAE